MAVIQAAGTIRWGVIMKKTIVMAMIAGACLALFGGDEGDDSWLDAKGTTWNFHWARSGDSYTATITSANPLPSAACSPYRPR